MQVTLNWNQSTVLLQPGKLVLTLNQKTCGLESQPKMMYEEHVELEEHAENQ